MSAIISDRNTSLSETNHGSPPNDTGGSLVAGAKLVGTSGGVTVISISSGKSNKSNLLRERTRSTTPPAPPSHPSATRQGAAAILLSSPPTSSSSPCTPSSSKTHRPALTGPKCMVCHDLAPNDTVFRRHYGVVCCEACKCFFRRTVQMNRDYKCRYGSSCSIGRNTDNLKQICQACRFNQCIMAGMKLDCELRC